MLVHPYVPRHRRTAIWAWKDHPIIQHLRNSTMSVITQLLTACRNVGVWTKGPFHPQTLEKGPDSSIQSVPSPSPVQLPRRLSCRRRHHQEQAGRAVPKARLSRVRPPVPVVVAAAAAVVAELPGNDGPAPVGTRPTNVHHRPRIPRMPLPRHISATACAAAKKFHRR